MKGLILMKDISKRYSLEGIEIEPEVKAYISQKLKIQEKLELNKDLQLLFSKEQIDKTIEKEVISRLEKALKESEKKMNKS